MVSREDPGTRLFCKARASSQMKMVAVTQRVRNPKRSPSDAIDLKWILFLHRCGLVPVLIPNDLREAKKMMALFPIEGLLLTGGNDLGEARGRDRVERFLLKHAIREKLPVIGVCRGMQLIQ